jgi:hypothetical protein
MIEPAPAYRGANGRTAGAMALGILRALTATRRRASVRAIRSAAKRPGAPGGFAKSCELGLNLSRRFGHLPVYVGSGKPAHS